MVGVAVSGGNVTITVGVLVGVAVSGVTPGWGVLVLVGVGVGVAVLPGVLVAVGDGISVAVSVISDDWSAAIPGFVPKPGCSSITRRSPIVTTTISAMVDECLMVRFPSI